MATDRTSIHAALDDLIDQGVDPTEVTGAIARSLSYQRERDVEPLLQDSRRYVLLPIQYPDIWEIYKRAVSAFWTVDEIDLKSDVDDWEHRLTENERTFIKNILAFFAASDFIVNENLMDRFMNEVKVPEAQCFYAFQAAVESIHSESYSLLLDTFIRDPVEKRHALNAVETIPCIKKKAGWAQKWIADRDSTFAKRLVCFAIVEGVMFSGSFCALYWLRKRNLMKGLTFSNSLIARDEGLHTEHACILYSHVVNKLTDEEIHRIMEEAVAIETEFICSSIPCAMLGMNSKQMSEFIRFVADRLLLQLGHPKLYGARNPFDFMDLSAVYSKSSFFEQRPSEYQRANIGLQASDMEFGTDADF